MAKPYDERAARKAYVRKRQQKVFSIVGVIMAVAMVVSLMFYFHIFGLGQIETAASLPNYGKTVPCAPTDSDGKTVKYSKNQNVNIRVLNGTTSLHLASAVSSALLNRGFPEPQATNYSSSKVERTTIYFGKNAIADAYTVNGNFTDAMMVMDDREDMLIDVVIGATFNDLSDDAPSPDDTIKNFEGCVAADKITDLPKALSHNPINPASSGAATQ